MATMMSTCSETSRVHGRSQWPGDNWRETWKCWLLCVAAVAIVVLCCLVVLSICFTIQFMCRRLNIRKPSMTSHTFPHPQLISVHFPLVAVFMTSLASPLTGTPASLLQHQHHLHRLPSRVPTPSPNEFISRPIITSTQ